MENRLDELGINDDNLYAADDDLDIELGEIDVKSGIETGFDESTPEDSKFINKFYSDVGEIKASLEEVRENTEDLKEAYDKSFGKVRLILEKENEQKERLNQLRRKTSGLLSEVKEKLKAIESDNKSMEEQLKDEMQERIDAGEGGGGWKTSEYRMRENMYNTLIKDFASCVNRFQEVELEYKQKQRDEIKRKLEIVNEGNEIGDEMIEGFIKNPRPIFIERLKGTGVWRTVQTEYEVACETREDLLELETNMNELVEMFRDMYALVNMQQDLIDNIENNVQDAVEYVKKGTKQVHKAREDSKRGKRCFLIAVVVIVILIIVIVVLLGIAAGVVIPVVTSLLGG